MMENNSEINSFPEDYTDQKVIYTEDIRSVWKNAFAVLRGRIEVLNEEIRRASWQRLIITVISIDVLALFIDRFLFGVARDILFVRESAASVILLSETFLFMWYFVFVFPLHLTALLVTGFTINFIARQLHRVVRVLQICQTLAIVDLAFRIVFVVFLGSSQLVAEMGRVSAAFGTEFLPIPLVAYQPISTVLVIVSVAVAVYQIFIMIQALGLLFEIEIRRFWRRFLFIILVGEVLDSILLGMIMNLRPIENVYTFLWQHLSEFFIRLR